MKESFSSSFFLSVLLLVFFHLNKELQNLDKGLSVEIRRKLCFSFFGDILTNDVTE